MRRDSVPVSLESPCQGPQSKTPLSALNRWRDSDNGVVAILGGARLVPRRPLQPFRAGFDPPALHFYLR